MSQLGVLPFLQNLPSKARKFILSCQKKGEIKYGIVISTEQ
jgi:hypothetical protein